MSWVDARLDEVADVILGQSPPGASYNESGEGVPFFQGKAEFGDLRPTVRKWTTAGTKFATTDDVLLSVRAPVGPTNLSPFDCVIGRGLAAIRPRGDIESRYVLWVLRATSGRLSAQATGSTFEAVTGKQVKAHSIPVAPLNEQRRIVAAIEEHLSRLDAADAYLKACLARVASVRSGVLQAITSADGDRFTVGEIAEVQGGIQKQPKRRPVKNRFPFLRVANVLRGELDLAEVHEIELFDGELERLALRTGDLLVVEGNGSPTQIGRSAMWHGEIDPCVHQNHLIRVRPGDALDSRYLDLYWNAPQTASRIASVASSTSGLYTLSASKVRSVEVVVPPLPEQRRIVQEVEERLSAIDALRSAIERAQRRSAALRRAVLERAFRGQLVPQDPSDEPAESLLARIRATDG